MKNFNTNNYSTESADKKNSGFNMMSLISKKYRGLNKAQKQTCIYNQQLSFFNMGL